MTSEDSHQQETHEAAEDIAIVGMSCIFPGAPDLGSFWRNVLQKVDAVTDPPEEAWDKSVYYDPDSDSNDRVYCKQGGFIGPYASFDPTEFGVIPLAVEGGEPDQWLALKVAAAALRDAGYEEDIPERHRTAVILGKGTYLNRGNLGVVQHGKVMDQTLQILSRLHPEYTQAELAEIRKELKQCLPPFGADTAPGLVPNVIAGRIANRFDFMGPNYTVDAACASSLLSVEMAVRGLRSGEYDMALVGGAHVVTPVPVLMLFCQLGALSRQEQIRPFDKDADGTILGEGIGMLVLKRRSDAERDGQRIYATIKGTGSSSDGRALGVMAPRIEGEIMALERAYASAGVAPGTVGLIEAHGTGTPVGDAVEVQALAHLFGANNGAPTCALGTVKSMLGHLMPAAGIAGIIKTALALHHKVKPATLHVDAPNPKLELEKTPFYLNTETRPWIHGTQEHPRRAGVNSFGFGGINAHVILEEAGTPESGDMPGQDFEWASEVLLLAASSRDDLVHRIDAVDRVLEADPQLSLKNLAFTLNVPYPEGKYRLAIVTSGHDDLRGKLKKLKERLADPDCRRIKTPQGIYYETEPQPGRLAVLFPGEGSQYVNMLADLAVHFPELRASFDAIDRIFLEQRRGYLPSDFIFPPPGFSDAERQAANERIMKMEGAVEAVLSANRGLWTLLSKLGLKPDAVLGHSTGEYSAMLAAGMIRLDDDAAVGEFVSGLNEIHREAAARGEIPRAVLLSIASDRATVSGLLAAFDGHAVVAMDNCPHQTVVAVQEDSAEAVLEELGRRGLIYERLAFDRPYHTGWFGPFAENLRAFFSRWIVSPPRIETYSCTSAAAFPADLGEICDLEIRHWMEPVEFSRTVETMYEQGIRIFVEAGPRGNLGAFVGDVLRGRPHVAVASDLMGVSGVNQLHHLVAQLGVHGVALDLGALYARRAPRTVSLDAAVAGARTGHTMKLKTGWPPMMLSEETGRRLRAAHQRAETPVSGDRGVTEAPPQAVPTPAPPPDREVVAGKAAVGRSAAGAELMPAYLQTMEQFLATQEQVMQAFLGRRQGGGEAGQREPAQPAQPAPVKAALAAGNSRSPAAADALPPERVTRPVEPAVPEPAGLDVRGLLLDLVSDRTGYPREMLDLDLNLEADLGVDSIKRVEILGALQKQTQLFRSDDLEKLSGASTLGEILDFLGQGGQEGPGNAGGPAAVSVEAGPAPSSTGPFIRQVLALQPGEALEALCELNPDEDRFLLDHTLGREISTSDPELRGLPVMPLTVSMEILAEAGAMLYPGMPLVEMRDIRAHRWIALTQDTFRLRVTARRCGAVSSGEARAEIFDAADPAGASKPILEATLCFASERPVPPPANLPALQGARTGRWETPAQVYKEGMFHGPQFRGVQRVDRTGDAGAEATLEVLPLDGLLRSSPATALLTDPVLLDQPGQVVGLWTAERLARGYVIFPYKVDALRLFGATPRGGERLRCLAHIDLIGEHQVRSDLEITGADGRVVVQFVGWEDMRFDLPERFYAFLMSPGEHYLSLPWQELVAAATGTLVSRRIRLADIGESLLESNQGFWKDVLAHLILSRAERDSWRALDTGEAARTRWLLVRIVIKEAVREFLGQAHGVSVNAADVDVDFDTSGRPRVSGAWASEMAALPLVSLAEAGEAVAASVVDSGGAAGLGLDMEVFSEASGDPGGSHLLHTEQADLSELPREKKAGSRWRGAKKVLEKVLGRFDEEPVLERIDPVKGH